MQYIIPFHQEHKERLMEVFDSNAPGYFDPIERSQFEEFFAGFYGGDYFIYHEDDTIYGAGGFCTQNPGEARIVWVMVDEQKHGKGIGRTLMKYFEELIRARKEYQKVSLKTSQLTDVFYEKLGYKTLYTEKDHWGEGLDLVYMEMEL